MNKERSNVIQIPLLLKACQEVLFMAEKTTNQKKNKTISVRLEPESERILDDQKTKGIGTSTYINRLIQTGGDTRSLHNCKVLVHMANLQSLIEGTDDPLLKEIREELNEL